MAFRIRDTLSAAFSQFDASALQTVPISIDLSNQTTDTAVLTYSTDTNNLVLSTNIHGPTGPVGPTGPAAPAFGDTNTGPTGTGSSLGPTGPTGRAGSANINLVGNAQNSWVTVGASAPTGVNDVIVGFAAASSSSGALDNSVTLGSNAQGNCPNAVSRNVQIGCQAAQYASGFNCVSVGYQSAYQMTGSNCVNLGESAGRGSVGAAKTCIGKHAGQSTSTGTNAIAIGAYSMSSAYGSDDIAIGQYTCDNFYPDVPIKGGGRIAIGRSALRGQFSETGATGSGWGNDNAIAIGNGAMSYTKGFRTLTYGNIAIGQGAASYINGSPNIAIGKSMLLTPTAFTSNCIGIGYFAGRLSFGGPGCIAIGPSAMSDTTSASGCCAIGLDAGARFISGNQNTFLGCNAGKFLQTGTNNTLVGYAADASSTSVDNEITLGNSFVTKLRCQVTTITALSDIRDKKNIQPLGDVSNFVKELKPAQFEWSCRNGGKTEGVGFGFVAQDIQQLQSKHFVVPELLSDTNPERLEVGMGAMIPLLVKNTQTVFHELQHLRNEIKKIAK